MRMFIKLKNMRIEKISWWPAHCKQWEVAMSYWFLYQVSPFAVIWMSWPVSYAACFTWLWLSSGILLNLAVIWSTSHFWTRNTYHETENNKACPLHRLSSFAVIWLHHSGWLNLCSTVCFTWLCLSSGILWKVYLIRSTNHVWNTGTRNVVT